MALLPPQCDFEDDVRAEVLRTLPHVPVDRAALEAMTPSDLLVLHLNWRKRFIAPHQRTIHRSKAFLANPMRSDPAYTAAIEHILDALENAGDVTPHLTTGIRIGYVAKSANDYGNVSDLDLLLNDWLVYHFHLSLVPRADGFVTRTGPLLFAIVGKTDAYIIDIFAHGAWHRDDVAAIIIDEWPNTNFVHPIPSITSAHTPTESERKGRRGAGINSGFIGRNGNWYIVGFGGMSSAGTSVQDSRMANVLVLGLRNFATSVTNNPTWVADAMRQSGVEPPAQPRLHFVIRPDGWYAVREEHTGRHFDIPGVPREAP